VGSYPRKRATKPKSQFLFDPLTKPVHRRAMALSSTPKTTAKQAPRASERCNESQEPSSSPLLQEVEAGQAVVIAALCPIAQLVPIQASLRRRAPRGDARESPWRTTSNAPWTT